MFNNSLKRRRTSKVELPSAGIGCRNILQFHEYGPPDAAETAYIQTTLHADELPGMLVSNYLIRLLDEVRMYMYMYIKLLSRYLFESLYYNNFHT